MTLILLMAAVTLLIMLLSFLSLTHEEREVNREYLRLLDRGARDDLSAGDEPSIRAVA
ncbi:hypothetical protein [Deinococcus koreensis]|uniref:hypothetical protein n=1 Tax=Deinococcus koreensis TaxID=2054903 RepID=UPI0013FD8E61|nr:hypothetical protein [Deinococcus koreensis]